MDYAMYVIDTETTGLDPYKYDIVELSIYRLKDDVCKTWQIQPTHPENFELGALRVNGLKIDDLQHKTEFGRKTYRDPNKVIVEVENFFAEDGVPAIQRLCIGHNIPFDMAFMKQLWIKCNAEDSYPLDRRFFDTMTIELFLDYCRGEMSNSYSMLNVIKKYGIKNEKAHSAEADTRATKDLFLKQVELFKKVLNA